MAYTIYQIELSQKKSERGEGKHSEEKWRRKQSKLYAHLSSLLAPPWTASQSPPRSPWTCPPAAHGAAPAAGTRALLWEHPSATVERSHSLVSDWQAVRGMLHPAHRWGGTVSWRPSSSNSLIWCWSLGSCRNTIKQWNIPEGSNCQKESTKLR